mgnify:CR=1 FL=1
MSKSEYKVVIESTEDEGQPQFVEESIKEIFREDDSVQVSVEKVD